MLPEIYAGCAERGNPDMAIFHYTIKIVGRSKGKSVISASAYLNGDVMKNEETGRISYYTSKKEVVYTSLMMCENAPPEWQIVLAMSKTPHTQYLCMFARHGNFFYHSKFIVTTSSKWYN